MWFMKNFIITKIVDNSILNNFYLKHFHVFSLGYICDKNGHDPRLCVPPRSVPDYKGIGSLIFDQMIHHKNNIAQIDADTGKEMSYNEILSKSIRCAQTLKSMSIQTTDVLSVCSGNNQYCCIPFISAMFLGIPISTLDPYISIKELSNLTDLIKPKIIFCDTDGEKIMAEVLKTSDVQSEVVSFYDSPGNVPFSEFLMEREPEEEFQPRVVDDLRETILITLTSGTTGFSKAVCVSHIGLMYHHGVAIMSNSVFWGLTRMFWLIGSINVLLAIFTGSAWVMSSNFLVDNIVKVIKKHKVNYLMSSPYYLHEIINHTKNHEYDFSSILGIAIGGNFIAQTQLDIILKLFPNAFLHVLYGSTESVLAPIGYHSVNNKDVMKNKINSCGIVSEGSCVKIVDVNTGKSLGPNQVGETRVKTFLTMNGYYNNPDETKECFDDQGYLKTGDLMYYDEDYCFYFVDRIKDQIKYGGVPVSIIELEELLLLHPNVKEVSIVGIPAGAVGDHTTGVVVLKKGSTTTPDDLIQYVNDAYYKKCEGEDHNPLLCVPQAEHPDIRPLGEIIFDKMKSGGEKICQIDADTGLKTSYSEMLSKSIRVAQTILSKGIKTDDVIAVCSANNQYCCIPFISAIMLGIPIVPLDPHLSLRDIIPLTDLIKPRMVFCDIPGEDLMNEVITKTGVDMEIVSFYNTGKYTQFFEFLVSKKPEEDFVPRKVEDLRETLIILLTSGTTGTAKGVCTSHIGWLGTLIGFFKFPSVTQWGLTRMYWLIGTLIVLGTIINQGTWIMSSNFEIDNIVRVINEYKVNLMISAPYYAYQMIEYTNNNEHDLSSVIFYALGGNPLSSKREEILNKIFPSAIIDITYGMTELLGGFIRFDPFKDEKLKERKPGSVGRVMQGFCVKVVDLETGRTLGVNQTGELRVKSNFIMNKYYNNPKETSDSFDDDGYFCTGDLMYYDEDYCFYFVERIKDFIKYGGVAVFTVELEEELLTHPDVMEATVVGIPAGDVGDHTTGIVVLKPGSSTTPLDLINYIAGRVSEKKRLHGGVVIVDHIPKTISYKSKRKHLRDLITSGQLKPQRN